jgi:Raf kinase inhibitor-like YbhB/YbcL family protein
MVFPIVVSSSAFPDGGLIPRRYTCRGDGSQPPLTVDRLPNSTRTLAVVVEDPDAPLMTVTHWVLFDIPATVPETTIPEDAGDLAGAAVPGRNSMWRRSWIPPCPPFGEHRYIFTVYALDARLGLQSGASARSVRRALEGHLLGLGRLVGRFSRRQRE